MAYIVDLPDTFPYDKFRNFTGLESTDIVEAFEMEYNYPNQVSCWICRIVYENGRYSNPDKPIIEFYSADTNQFVSAYYVETMLDHENGVGLCLDGGVPAWTIVGDDLVDILDWLEEISDTI